MNNLAAILIILVTFLVSGLVDMIFQLDPLPGFLLGVVIGFIGFSIAITFNKE